MVTSRQFISVCSFVAAGLVLGACTKDREASKEEPRPSAPATAPSAAPETLVTEDRQSIGRGLDAYEQIRAQFARDEVTAVTASAGALEQAAGEAAAKAPERLRARLQEIASSARNLKDMSKEDANAVRSAFGDVSRLVVALLEAEPALRQGRHIFECPMAQGYKKWVQTSAELSNPYMGTSMLSCGSASDWKADG
jgi:hypothetical protein